MRVLRIGNAVVPLFVTFAALQFVEQSHRVIRPFFGFHRCDLSIAHEVGQRPFERDHAFVGRVFRARLDQFGVVPRAKARAVWQVVYLRMNRLTNRAQPARCRWERLAGVVDAILASLGVGTLDAAPPCPKVETRPKRDQKPKRDDRQNDRPDDQKDIRPEHIQMRRKHGLRYGLR